MADGRHLENEAQLSPKHPHDTLYQLKCRSTFVRIMQTDRLSACGALSATAVFYSAACIDAIFAGIIFMQIGSVVWEELVTHTHGIWSMRLLVYG